MQPGKKVCMKEKKVRVLQNGPITCISISQNLINENGWEIALESLFPNRDSKMDRGVIEKHSQMNTKTFFGE
jgi:hypothetical protein